MKELYKRDGKKSGNPFDRFDFFGVKLPIFNLEGNPKVGSSIGGFLSLLMTVLILAYTAAKIRVCYKKSEL